MKKYREKWGEGKERVSGRKERERLREISRKGKREEIYIESLSHMHTLTHYSHVW